MTAPQWINTNDVVTGDIIRFTEAVWGGSYRRPKKLGERTIEAIVVGDSYGAKKQQHTFTLKVIDCDGYDDTLPTSSVVTRKGRNVYRNGVQRLKWDDEQERQAAAQEKHTRGTAARKQREIRRETVGKRGSDPWIN